MSQLIADQQQNWALFATMWEPPLDDKVAFSQWTSSTQYRFGYVGYDSDLQAKVAGSTECWGCALQN
ncbi:hypothetical protein [Paraburkholderia heleia]|uniref:hypothetical protein n=1 Tax=Paraburkholderia heleia TaxID=634127 RepID=UPI002AB6C60F|nr:hypothetical protein [Paraburkholderia heleia]